MRRLLTLLVILSLTACTSMNRPSPYASAAADIGTTAAVLNNGGVELNPLGFWGTTLLKGAYLLGVRPYIPEKERAEGDRVTASLWLGAAANNLTVLLLTLPTPVSLAIGLAVGISVYNPASDD